MEFVRRIQTPRGDVPPNLKNYISVFEKIDSKSQVGLTKNGLLVEYDVNDEQFHRSIKVSDAFQIMKIIHILENQYLVVLAKNSQDLLRVYKPKSKTFEIIYELNQKFVDFEVIDEQKKGYETLRIQCISSSIVKDFCVNKFDDHSKDSFTDSVDAALKKQAENAKNACEQVKNDVERLENIISGIESDLSANPVSVKESDLLKAAFGSKFSRPCYELTVIALKRYKTFVILSIENPHDSMVEDLILVIDCPKYKIKRTSLSVLDLEAMIIQQACNNVVQKVGIEADDKDHRFNLSSGTSVSLWKFYEFCICCHFFSNLIFQVNFVIDFGMELLNPCVNIMLQFKVNAKILVQRFDLNTESVESLNEIEATPIKMLMSEYKKTLIVYSAIERHFDLEKTLTSIGLAQMSVKNTFSSSDVICAFFPLNHYKYQLIFHSDSLKPLKILFTTLYDALPKDVIMDILKTNVQTDNKKVDKKSCLLREITALKTGQIVDETVTDKVFLE